MDTTASDITTLKSFVGGTTSTLNIKIFNTSTTFAMAKNISIVPKKDINLVPFSPILSSQSF